ncbi:protein phosphatase 1 regulatory subunit 3A isoform X1 [Pseudonaja textilis]|uniref:protein phosphatase 1 regulatory subunit 3A isoform X1 n=1 Tax=Pseudonaja textilis TaxID=8673 RepID=UPI000EA870B0|nr:protein phosphatase 1 regulatory subunit 3A isoform X1 [Pseudonaja textilis]
MESFEEPGHIGRENLLEVPTLSNCFSEEEDVKATHQHRFSPAPRRRNSDSSEEMEAEIPSTTARKVSFADAFGFDLVSVKEFDSWDNPITQPSDDLEDEDVPVDEFYLTPLFLVPTTQEELLQTVRAHKICLEFVEFLPGVICMKGIIRVLNITFQKLVYVRMSLDNWLTYYDILAEYVPNSCDGETDQFLFKISLVPPYQKEGAKVEFCIRYETSVGIFWSNNNSKNYVLICHKKGTASSLDNNKPQEGVTNKHIKGCLKTTLNSKEETLTMADKDIWINSRISDIPQIVYSHLDNENKYRKENEEEKNDGCNEDDKENEKELELLLSHHFTRSRSSSMNERSSYATEPVRFPNELQQLGDKLEPGLIRQPLPKSSSTEHSLQDKELQNNQTYSVGNNRQLLFPEKCSEVDLLNKTAQSLEGLNPNETYFSPEYWSEINKNQNIPDTVSSNCGMHPAYVQSEESKNVPRNKTKETLFIGEDNYNFKKTRETISLEDDEAGKLKENALKRKYNNIKTVQEQLKQETAFQIPELDSENIGHEPQREKVESKNKLCLNRGLNSDAMANADVTENCLASFHSEDIVEEKHKSEYNDDKEKEIMLENLENSPEKQISLTSRYRKHVLRDNYEINRLAKLPQREEVMTSSVPGEIKEQMSKSIGLPYLSDSGNSNNNKTESKSCIIDESNHDLKKEEIRIPEKLHNTLWESQSHIVPPVDEYVFMHSINTKKMSDSRNNLEKRKYSQNDNPENRNISEVEPCQSEPGTIILKDQSTWDRLMIQTPSGSENQLAERQSEANKRVQIKELTGVEAMGGINDNARCLKVSPTDELFTCQDAFRYEETSVTKHDNTEEAEAVTAASIIKMTSESIPEKMSASEKAVIVKLPQETALSDRPTEEKEMVFDIHEGRNDGSHYPLCQCNREGVLCDTKFGVSASHINNVPTYETVHVEMISTHAANEMLAKAEHNSVNNSPSTEIFCPFSAEGKIVSEQGVHCEGVQLNHSEHSSQGLHNKEVEEGSIWSSFSHLGPTTEPKMCHLDKNVVGSCYKNSSVISPKGFAGPRIAEVEEMSPPPTNASTEIAAQSGCNFNPKDETTHVITNTTKLQEFLPSENREGNISQFSHQTEFSPEKQIRPTILIRESTEEREETSLASEGLITEKKMNIIRHDKQAFFDHTGISSQKNEAYNSPAECLVLKHIAYKIFYFLLFIVFCVTLYHYDLIVCFALYLFSLCWLYCDGRRNKNSIKKE